ncbi:dtw domain containing protein [Lichtheimia corymbifera JMRC:FSU:9682]|uniref:tRNA-uridine aminocarboxypropyltransferase 1 n=1 Tax=Lichtheimia corymbifera JMRC:FSU:9682 TaxID=1263082 RepID=A0A068RN22_9FUNG|nr:dtw domain containing protein [Lichtheimia corymbifera JMRC:FSU:9682]
MSSTEIESRRPESPESNEPSNKRAKVATPFDDLKINDDSILDTVTDRSECPRCKKSVKYFCYRCFDVVGMERSEIPKVDLPVRLNVIKHERELDGKSTAVHAKVIAEDDVDFYTWGEIPDFEQPERSLLLFPGPDAKQLKDIPRDSYDRITVIDGTWRQASRIVRETPVLHKMQKVTIAPRKTHFWRFQQLSENHLATIEAIYYVYREFGEMVEGSYDDGRYDNLLFYYRYFYKMIQNVYRNNDKSFTHRHRKNYIQYDGDRSQQENKDEEGSKDSKKGEDNNDQQAKASE